MELHYCDLCENLLHGKRHVLVTVTDDDILAHKKRPQDVDRTQYEICDGCMELINKIFEMKKSRIHEIEEFLNRTYSVGEV